MQFDRMEEARRRAARFGDTLEELCARLSPWPEEVAVIQELRDVYASKSAAFLSRDTLSVWRSLAR